MRCACRWISHEATRHTRPRNQVFCRHEPPYPRVLPPGRHAGYGRGGWFLHIRIPPWTCPAGQTGQGPLKQIGRRSSATGCFGSGLGCVDWVLASERVPKEREEAPFLRRLCPAPRDPVLGADGDVSFVRRPEFARETAGARDADGRTRTMPSRAVRTRLPPELWPPPEEADPPEEPPCEPPPPPPLDPAPAELPPPPAPCCANVLEENSRMKAELK